MEQEHCSNSEESDGEECACGETLQ